MMEKETNREKKKIYRPDRRGDCLNKPWYSHSMEHCAAIETMFTEGL